MSSTLAAGIARPTFVIVVLLLCFAAQAQAARFENVGIGRGYGGHHLAVCGTTLYTANQSESVAIIDAVDPANLRRAGQYAAENRVIGLYVAGGVLYVLCSGGRVEIAALAAAPKPRRVGVYETKGLVSDLAVVGDRLIVVGAATSDPGIRGHLLHPDGTREVVLPEGAGMLEVVSVSDPAKPRRLSRIELPWMANGVVLVDRFALVADVREGVQIVDLAEPASPRWVTSIATPGTAEDLALIGDCAVVADGAAGGVVVIDVSDPEHPQRAGGIQTSGSANAVAVNGRQIVVADGNKAVRVFTLTEAGQLDTVAADLPAGYVGDVATQGDLIIRADRSGDLVVSRLVGG